MTITPEEIARLRALEAKGPDLNGAEITELTDARLTPLLDEIERLRAENDRLRVLTTCVGHMLKRDDLRDDLREAVALLNAHGEAPEWLDHPQDQDWLSRYGKLLAKHKETL